MNGFGTIGDNETYFGCGNVGTVDVANIVSSGMNVATNIFSSVNDRKAAEANSKAMISAAEINMQAARETNKANQEALRISFENARESEKAQLEAARMQCQSAEEQKRIDLEIAKLDAMKFANGGGGGNTKLYIGIGVGCVALVGVLAVVLLKK